MQPRLGYNGYSFLTMSQSLPSIERVFNIDIEVCNECGGTVKIIASIEDPAIIKKILTHLESTKQLL